MGLISVAAWFVAFIGCVRRDGRGFRSEAVRGEPDRPPCRRGDRDGEWPLFPFPFLPCAGEKGDAFGEWWEGVGAGRSEERV